MDIFPRKQQKLRNSFPVKYSYLRVFSKLLQGETFMLLVLLLMSPAAELLAGIPFVSSVTSKFGGVLRSLVTYSLQVTPGIRLLRDKSSPIESMTIPIRT
jgi:hypothetical protein